jgi:hypothetical protein
MQTKDRTDVSHKEYPAMGQSPYPPRPPHGGPGRVINAINTLARWLDQIQFDTSGSAMERLLSSRSYGQLFWRMRDLGSAVRETAFTALNASFNRQTVPDSRNADHFSQLSVAREAARQTGLHVFPAPEIDALQAEAIDTTRSYKTLAWLHAYQGARVPDLCLRYTPHDAALAFQAACCVGWWMKERAMFEGPGQPGGIFLLPDHTRDRHFSPLLHNFAKGLLLLNRTCPLALGCHCNLIIAMLDEPPDDHPQPTGAQNLYALQRYASAPPTPQQQPHRNSAPPNSRFNTRPLGGGDPWGTQ